MGQYVNAFELGTSSRNKTQTADFIYFQYCIFFFAANKGLEIIWGQFLIQTDFFLSIFLSSFQLFQ